MGRLFHSRRYTFVTFPKSSSNVSGVYTLNIFDKVDGDFKASIDFEDPINYVEEISEDYIAISQSGMSYGKVIVMKVGQDKNARRRSSLSGQFAKPLLSYVGEHGFPYKVEWIKSVAILESKDVIVFLAGGAFDIAAISFGIADGTFSTYSETWRTPVKPCTRAVGNKLLMYADDQVMCVIVEEDGRFHCESSQHTGFVIRDVMLKDQRIFLVDCGGNLWILDKMNIINASLEEKIISIADAGDQVYVLDGKNSVRKLVF